MWAADDASVRWDEFEKRQGEETNESCVPHESIKQMETNSVLIMKEDAWPGIRGMGLTHKAPEVEEDPPKRLILKVDLHIDRPPLATDDDEFDEIDSLRDVDEDENDEEEEGQGEDEERWTELNYTMTHNQESEEVRPVARPGAPMAWLARCVLPPKATKRLATSDEPGSTKAPKRRRNR